MKKFYIDIEMMINALGFESIKEISQDDIGMNQGYLYEAIIVDSLYKDGIPLYYFRKESGLEIDFVI